MDKAVWDEEKLNKLKSLWEEGLPITKIGVELGVSRNAIAGKAHRMNLPKRNSPISKLGDPRKNQKKDDEQKHKMVRGPRPWLRNSMTPASVRWT